MVSIVRVESDESELRVSSSCAVKIFGSFRMPKIGKFVTRHSYSPLPTPVDRDKKKAPPFRWRLFLQARDGLDDRSVRGVEEMIVRCARAGDDPLRGGCI